MTTVPIVGSPQPETVQVAFNLRGPQVRDSLQGTALAPLPTDLVKNTPSLWNADLDDAYRYGGEITRIALSCCALRGDRRYTVVDTKVHMLMPGMLPAIPGWHTDGAPRAVDGNPSAGGPPLLDRLLALDKDPENRPRYHLFLADCGTGSLTEFLNEPYTVALPAQPTADLYAMLTRGIESERRASDRMYPAGWMTPNLTVVEFDWLDVHRAIAATGTGWRFLMRVTETDWLTPRTNLRDVIRLHNPVYVPEEYGW